MFFFGLTKITSNHLLQGAVQSPQKRPIFFRAFSATFISLLILSIFVIDIIALLILMLTFKLILTFISLLILSRPSSMWSNCSRRDGEDYDRILTQIHPITTLHSQSQGAFLLGKLKKERKNHNTVTKQGYQWGLNVCFVCISLKNAGIIGARRHCGKK